MTAAGEAPLDLTVARDDIRLKMGERVNDAPGAWPRQEEHPNTLACARERAAR